MLVFAQANPSRLPLTWESSSQRYLSGVFYNIQLNVLDDLAEAMKALDGRKNVRRMANNALVRILRRFLTPAATVTLPGLHDLYPRDNLLPSRTARWPRPHCHSSTVIGHPHWTIRLVHCRGVWGSRVSLLTYKAIVVRYPELVLHDQDLYKLGISCLTIIQLNMEDSELSCGMHRKIFVQQSRTQLPSSPTYKNVIETSAKEPQLSC